MVVYVVAVEVALAIATTAKTTLSALKPTPETAVWALRMAPGQFGNRGSQIAGGGDGDSEAGEDGGMGI